MLKVNNNLAQLIRPCYSQAAYHRGRRFVKVIQEHGLIALFLDKDMSTPFLKFEEF